LAGGGGHRIGMARAEADELRRPGAQVGDGDDAVGGKLDSIPGSTFLTCSFDAR
jgi:hypothetical protein